MGPGGLLEDEDVRRRGLCYRDNWVGLADISTLFRSFSPPGLYNRDSKRSK